MIRQTCGRNGYGEVLNTETGSAGVQSNEQIGRQEG